MSRRMTEGLHLMAVSGGLGFGVFRRRGRVNLGGKKINCMLHNADLREPQ